MNKLGMVAYICNPITQKTEAEDSKFGAHQLTANFKLAIAT